MKTQCGKFANSRVAYWVCDDLLDLMTTSGYDVPEWLQPFTEGLVEGGTGSSDIFQQDPRTNQDGNTDLVIFRRTPLVIDANAQKITRAPCRRKPESREDRIPQAITFWDTTTADHNVLNEENGSR